MFKRVIGVLLEVLAPLRARASLAGPGMQIGSLALEVRRQTPRPGKNSASTDRRGAPRRESRRAISRLGHR